MADQAVSLRNGLLSTTGTGTPGDGMGTGPMEPGVWTALFKCRLMVDREPREGGHS
jgi:hypothetical protein